jgi:hypothetical protein
LLLGSGRTRTAPPSGFGEEEFRIVEGGFYIGKGKLGFTEWCLGAMSVHVRLDVSAVDEA